jgi:hypothetical protein
LKYALSLLLVVLLLCGMAAPAFAEGVHYHTNWGSKVPVVLVGGDGVPLADQDGNEICRFVDISNALKSSDGSNLKTSVMNVVKPLLVQGLLTGNYQPYYDALYQEVAELFSDVLLDENGDPRNGSGLSGWHLWFMEDRLNQDMKLSGDGSYHLADYQFYYDWRLDPLETADKLRDHIERVKALTGSSQVALVCRCVGANVVYAYIAKYGTDSLYSLGMDGVVGLYGCEPMSEAISGKFRVNLPAINRLLVDLQALDMIGELDPLIESTVALAAASPAITMTKEALRLTIYQKIVEGATSALALSTFFSCPMYWACVNAEDYDDAMQYVFGDEGSEKRVKYAGLIEKIENYNTQVRQRLPEILQEIKETVSRVCVISKYGYQLAAVSESADMVSDQIATVRSSSFGATTSKVYETLSESYLAKQIEAGKERYLSPDEQIDASTCLFPEQTWFAKGARHSNWTWTENDLMYTVVTSEEVLTCDDLDVPRFFVEQNDEYGTWEPMTAENCHTENWSTEKDDNAPTGFMAKLRAYFKAVSVWIRLVVEKLRSLFAPKAD